MPKLNAFVTKLTGGGGKPLPALVLRGYLSTPEIIKTLDDMRNVAQGAVVGADVNRVLDAIRATLGPDPARLYLSAKMDCYVDFDWVDDLIHSVPPTGTGVGSVEDSSTTVWLRRRPADRPYVLVETASLDPAQGFVRGKLVDDFMADSEAQFVWDTQGYAPNTGKTSRMYCT